MLRLLLTFIFCITCCFGYAQPQYWEWTDFSGGQNSHVSEYNVPRNQSATCQNMRVNKDFGTLSKRATMLSFADAGSAAIKSLHKYYKSDGTQYLLATESTNLDAISDTGTITNLQSDLSDAARWTWETYKDVAIGGNGVDNIQKWDGKIQTTADTDESRTAGDLCAELGAPFAELNTGTDLDASSWYQYKVAFYNGTSYSYSTARSNPIQTGASVYNITLTDIPLGPTGTTHRYIYRTVGNASKSAVEADTSYYQVDAIADNSTRTYDDGESDATILADAAPTWATVSAGVNGTPPAGNFVKIHDNYFFVAGVTGLMSELYWSDTYNPDYFAPLDFEKIRPDDGDEITFLAIVKGTLTIGKDNTIQNYYTESADPSYWRVSSPIASIGCPSPFSVAESPIGIIFLGWGGIYAYTGNNVQLISDAVTDEIRDITASDMENVVGHYFDNEYMLSYISNESGEAINNRVLIYDVVRDAYVKDSKNIDSFIALDSGDDFGIVYSGNSDTAGTIYAHEFVIPSLKIRYKSQLDEGTYDDTYASGTESDPVLSLGWDCTIDGWLTELQSKDGSINTIDDINTYITDATINMPDTDGTWTSPVYLVSAGALDKLYWNESLGSTGDITFNLRTGATTGACEVATWSTAYTNPVGSDISGESADVYLQLKANFSTTDTQYTPSIYLREGFLFKVLYYRTSSTLESAFVSLCESGWKDFQPVGRPKFLRRMKVYYTGEEGTITMGYKNEEGDSDATFDIDVSVEPTDDVDDDYEGVGGSKVYTYWFPVNADGEAPIGVKWWFSITDTSTDEWSIERVEIMYDFNEAPEF